MQWNWFCGPHPQIILQPLHTLPLLINPACVLFLESRESVSGLTERGRSEHVAWYRCSLEVPVVLETHSGSWDENWPLEEPSHSGS